ncbi:cyclophane-forming radical SAM/SPASM peptide maturase YhhB [Chryseobacterium scophthalmum]|uniref:Radical SAM core domain-containing protein n=1 Tax=Chryseobacterium scophthalmum TaxID=59733 RepID=A0A1N6HMN2_9FLAO|nr:cyclophane-forming radical SAM/SPASM peptide maturase YhhB [Chryseobacterium scophthalmum]SIO21030.1 uncharacterized protein SAMN05421769_2672 [Chryseobacterium scophthalmum]
MQVSNQPIIRCFLFKVASRCNINCDYCYMYNHLDQSYKSQPKIMSKEILETAATRINEYVVENSIDRIAIVYHGGEPLLLGAEVLAKHVEYVRNMIRQETIVDFSLQTNGVLLKETDLELFEKCGLQVSLSLDGGQTANDKHRLDHRGKSTFADTEKALRLLEKKPNVFAGVIAVIDPFNDPSEILSFFSNYDIPQLDFLLPDANYVTIPPHRNEQPDIYENWLLNCFDLWFDHYSALKVRTFDSILASLLGAPSETDGFGFGDVGLITIETDGTYHDLDVLKITGEGTDLTRGDVKTTNIAYAIDSESVKKHRELLRKDGLCLTCQECSVVDVCGGGAVAHRYSDTGFLNPSIYCKELKNLIEHANKKVTDQLQIELDTNSISQISENDIQEYELETGVNNSFINILESFRNSQSEMFMTTISQINKEEYNATVEKILALEPNTLKQIATSPAVVAWTEVIKRRLEGSEAKSVDGETLPIDLKYLQDILNCDITNLFAWPKLQNSDKWLRLPFGNRVYFEDLSQVTDGQTVINKALNLIVKWKSSIVDEMKAISPDVLFIRDLDAPLDRVVSFSDNSVPGALYVQLMRNDKYIHPADLADSIIHEHRHQKLYLLQRVCPIVYSDYPLVASPWREELRPPSGLFHALYVFVELLDFWAFLRKSKEQGLTDVATNNCRKISDQLITGFEVIDKCDLTLLGRELLNCLKNRCEYLMIDDEN